MSESRMEVAVEILEADKSRCKTYLSTAPETYKGLEYNIDAYSFAIQAIEKNYKAINECRETLERLEEQYSNLMSDRLDASIFAYKNILRILEETT